MAKVATHDTRQTQSNRDRRGGFQGRAPVPLRRPPNLRRRLRAPARRHRGRGAPARGVGDVRAAKPGPRVRVLRAPPPLRRGAPPAGRHGLDSLALRRPAFLDGITIVEVDHPDSQRWKRARIAALGLEPRDVAYVAVDFSRDDPGERLSESGTRLDEPIFFSWFGVTRYIDRAANDATLPLGS